MTKQIPAPPIPSRSWTSPAITILEVKLAAGSTPGSLCDKYGALSRSCAPPDPD